MHLCGLDLVFRTRKSKNNKQKEQDEKEKETGEDIADVLSRTKDFTIYTYKEICIATNYFDRSNRIGIGGFGTVYKGILKDGIAIAVKKLSSQSKQGVREFLTEIATISDAKHENLVKLYGCCVEEDQRILVYEYLENNSLAQALFGSNKGRLELDWRKRADICIGTACGLAFLHEELIPHVVHRDIKASNVLLDGDFKPKISDFGLAKLFPDNVTHISTRVAGTIGYLAPEYARHGQLTKKADIYSFGILALEIISGRPNSDSFRRYEEQDLLEMQTWKLKDENKLLEVVDPSIEDYPAEEVIRFIKVALLCTQTAANFRPPMSQVVAMLSKNININENLLVRQGGVPNYKNLVFSHASKPSNQTSIDVMHSTSKAASSSTFSSVTATLNTSPEMLSDMEGR